MNETSENSPKPTGPGALSWAAVVLCLIGLALAGLLWIAGMKADQASASGLPMCGGVELAGLWFDCDTVITSHWSAVLGVSVAMLATALYLALLVLAVFEGEAEGGRWARLRRVGLLSGATAAALAGVWFFVVQFLVIDAFCLWCSLTHLVGLVLCGVMWLWVGGRVIWKVRAAATVLAVLGVGGIVAGQVLVSPSYVGRFGLVETGEDEPLREVGVEAGGLTLGAGRVVLNPAAHPLLGDAEAERVVVELIDPTCKRCRATATLLRRARSMTRQPFAVAVLFVPLSPKCNPVMLEPSPGSEQACEYIRLMLAVWLADPGRYEGYHRWLMESETIPSVEAARAEAERRVGPTALERALADPRIDERIALDLTIAERLEVRQLPGLIIGDTRFRAIPADAGTMASLINQAFSDVSAAE